MQDVLILGAGTAGTMAAAALVKKLPKGEWRLTIVDADDDHVYQPGLLMLPFGTYSESDLVRSRRRTLPKGVDFVVGEIDRVDAEAQTVTLMDGDVLQYDYLVIASGTTPRPDQTPGMDGDLWRKQVHEFYTLEGALALREALARFQGGRVVINIVEMPIKCPVAPLEFTFLADAHFSERNLREKVEITYVTPLDGAFTQPVASERLGGMLADRNIRVEPDFMLERVDEENRTLVSYDEREVTFDLLVTIPLNMGADFIARSGLGDELNYVAVDKETLLSVDHPEIFVLGDANSIPTSKAGSVAHFQVEKFAENFVLHAAGAAMTHPFDGHANCFIETGHGKGLLIDFNYETQPLPGTYPIPGVGPFPLLAESRRNHWGKLAFKYLYWYFLLPGRPLPIPAHMTRAGKDFDAVPAQSTSTVPEF